MNSVTSRRGFTLVELTVVVALIAITVGTTTLSMRGMSDQGRLQSVASRIGAFHRLVVCEAMYTDRPRIMQFDRHGFTVRKPVLSEGRWHWSVSPRVDLGPRVGIVTVFRSGSEALRSSPEPPWTVAIVPGVLNSDCVVEFRLDNGTGGLVTVNAVTGVARLEMKRAESG